MAYIWKYKTPQGLDDMLMSSDGEYLTGLWFNRPKEPVRRPAEGAEEFVPVFGKTKEWLDAYFAGCPLKELPDIKIKDITPFRRDVLEIVKEIPFGSTLSYGEIASRIAEKRGLKRMSAQAVGGAVGWNPVCIMIPCHRVIGADGSLTGYGGGIKNKELLLRFEQARRSNGY